MSTEGHNRVLVERFATNETSEGKVLVIGIVVVLCSSFARLLLGHEGSGGGVGGEEGVVELPTVKVVPTVVQELAGISKATESGFCRAAAYQRKSERAESAKAEMRRDESSPL